MARRRRTPEIIAGRVNADGSIAAGDGFTVVKTATGIYAISLPSGFRLIAATASVWGTSNFFAQTANYAERSFEVRGLTTAAAAQDTTFTFVAVGVQQ